MSFRFRTFCSALGVLFCCAGCGSELARSARSDSLEQFRRVLTVERESGELDKDAIEEVAHAVAVRELLSNYGDAGVARVDELADCASELIDPLRKVSTRSDASGAAAAQVLIDTGHERRSLDALVEQFASHPEPAWRAVGARAAIRPEQRAVRLKGYLDGDLRVRRAALRAAGVAADAGEVEQLLEAARLDPDAVSRRFALQALSAIGEPKSLGRLRDVWVFAREDDRRAITHAWALKHAYTRGGEGHLMWVTATQAGLPQLSAAVILYQNRALSHQQALAVLVRGLEQGAPDEKRYAIAFAPRTEQRVRVALEKAAKDDDEWTAAVAASALLRVSTARLAARSQLRKLLHSERAEAARQARYALAAIGDRSALEPIESTLASEDLETRLEAGRLLMWLGDNDTAAMLLADSAASVRTQVACEVLSAKVAQGQAYPPRH